MHFRYMTRWEVIVWLTKVVCAYCSRLLARGVSFDVGGNICVHVHVMSYKATLATR